MFEKGDYIIYGTSGVCQVESITTMNLDGVSKERLFYVLIPTSPNGGKIFTPVDSEKTFMRGILNKEEASRLIEEIPEIELLRGDDDKQREEKYKACMRSGSCKDWIKIIKTLHLRKQERNLQGKKVTATDDKYLKQAESYLYGELSIPLGIPRENMEAFIAHRLGVQQS